MKKRNEIAVGISLGGSILLLCVALSWDACLLLSCLLALGIAGVMDEAGL